MTLRWVAQLGIQWVSLGESESLKIGRKGAWSKWQIEDLRDRLGSFGLQLHSLTIPAQWLEAPRHLNDEVHRAIDDVRESLIAAGEAQVAVVEWPWSAETRWGGDISPAESLATLAFFGASVMGTAEEAGVKMSLRPIPAYSHGFRHLFESVESLESFFDDVPSAANGITMSHSTIAGPKVDLTEAIRRMGARGRIHHAVMRTDTNGQFPDFETGGLDGLEIMQAYKQSGYGLAIVSDHAGELPSDLRETKIGCSFSHGYLRGLLQAVNA